MFSEHDAIIMAQKIIVKILFIGTLVQSPVIIIQILMLILLLIKPALFQMLYELRMIPLESRKQIAMRKLSKTIIYCSEILQ